MLKEQAFKAKEIPKNHYLPDMLVLKSTKNLTGFKEFGFCGSTTSLNGTKGFDYETNKYSSYNVMKEGGGS